VLGVLPSRKPKEDADEVFVVVDAEELDGIDDVDDVEVVVGVEEDDVVDGLEDVGVVLIVRGLAGKLLVSFVVTQAQTGEGRSAR
jgi:hypothetical protein